MIYLVNGLNRMIVAEFETMAQAHQHLKGMSRFSVENAYLIEGERKSISTSVTYKVEGSKPDTLPNQ